MSGNGHISLARLHIFDIDIKKQKGNAALCGLPWACTGMEMMKGFKVEKAGIWPQSHLALTQRARRWSKGVSLLSAAAISIALSFGWPVCVKAEEVDAREGISLLDFSDDTMRAFKARVQNSAEVAAAWQLNKALADQFVAVPINKISLAPGSLEHTLEPVILAWRMTGDQRYEQRIHDVLRAMCRRDSWVTDKPLLSRDPVWHSDLGMGVYGQVFGRAYSAIRETLTPAERTELVQGYVNGEVVPVFADWLDDRTRIHALDTMGHNWWGHIVFGMGFGLVAILPDEPRAKEWLRQVNEAGQEWWSYGGSDLETKIATFDKDGGYSETVNYGELAVGSYLQFRRAWTEGVLQPPAPAPLLPKVLDFFIHNVYPSSTQTMSVDFGDGSLEANGSPAIATAYALGEHRADYLWYINLFNSGEKDNLHLVPHILVSVPFASEPGGQGKAPDLPLDAWYRGIGWVTLRSSWDKDATFLAIRSGFTWNHNHADTGSFILFDQGRPLLIDSGNSSYSAPEYDTFYRQSVAHNVVTFDGKAEPEEDTYLGSQLPGRIPLMLDGDGIRYVLADATGPTSANFSRNFRHVLWIDDVILIIDDVKAREPGQFEWLIHPAGEARAVDGALRVDNAGAVVDVRPLFPKPMPTGGLPSDYPEDMHLVTHEGFQDHDPKTRVTYYAFAPAEKTERVKFITALVPKSAQAETTIERLDEKSGPALRIRSKGKVTDIYLNIEADGSIRHRNANNQLGGYDSDAYLLAVTHSEGTTNPSRLFVADGSYLRRDGKVEFDSLSKRFFIADFTPSAPNLWVAGQAGAQMRLAWPQSPANLMLNGESIATTRIGDLVEFTCCDTEFGQ